LRGRLSEMEEKIDENKPYDCFVAFLDIMGFKERLLRDGHEKVREKLELLLPAISTIEKIAKHLSKKTATVKPVVFSDSIILISSDITSDAFIWMIIFVQLMLSNAFLNDIPMKGAIAYGKMTTDEKHSLYFGQPLIDAFELQNELKLYGVVLHHTFEKCFLEFLTLKDFKEPDIYQYLVPLKYGEITHYLVDWTSFIQEEINTLDLVNRFYNNVSGKPRIYVDNTLKFLDWLKTEKAKKEKEKKS
jgi:hypothetical protein